MNQAIIDMMVNALSKQTVEQQKKWIELSSRPAAMGGCLTAVSEKYPAGTTMKAGGTWVTREEIKAVAEALSSHLSK